MRIRSSAATLPSLAASGRLLGGKCCSSALAQAMTSFARSAGSIGTSPTLGSKSMPSRERRCRVSASAG